MNTNKRFAIIIACLLYEILDWLIFLVKMVKRIMQYGR